MELALHLCGISFFNRNWKYLCWYFHIPIINIKSKTVLLIFQEELLAKKRAERRARLAAVQQDVQEKLKLLEDSYQEKEQAMRAQFEHLEKSAGYLWVIHL